MQDLAGRALTVTTDPELRLRARATAGWALAYAGRRSAAFTSSSRSRRRHAAELPALAWEALADAATVAYQAGTPASRQAVRPRPAPAGGPRPAAAAAPTRPGAQSTSPAEAVDTRLHRPVRQRQRARPVLRRIAGTAMDEAALWRVGSAAWLLDESAFAVRLLQDAMDRIQAPGRQGASGGGLTALGWLYLDTGRWDEALEAAAEAADLAEANQMVMVAAAADAITATVLALRADSGAARVHAERALAGVRPGRKGADRRPGLAGARRRGARRRATTCTPTPAWPAVQRGRRPRAQLLLLPGRGRFRRRRRPRGRRDEGRPPRARARPARRDASPRLDQLIARARGILADPAGRAPTSPPRSPTRPAASGRSSAPSSASTTQNGCGGSAGSTKRSRN